MPQILNVKVDSITRPEALALVDQMIRHGGQHIITTPNPEMLVGAQKDEEFRNALNRSALALPDGVGLMLAGRVLKKPLQMRIAGSDFVFDILELAAKKGYTVYLLGGEEGIAQQAAEKLKIKYGELKIVGADSGPQNLQFETCDLQSIQNAHPDILLVAFGHGNQEKWIVKYLHELPSVKIAMGVGGVFDFISGRIRRAPRIFRKFGIEWLWRLLREPRRLPRIWRAVVVFPWYVLTKR